MMTPYNDDRGSNPKINAQRNLAGRTHYVDDDTLRFHKSRVISARAVDDGLLFAIVTSDALDWNNTRRGYRYVVFDVTGRVVSRVDLEDAFKTSRQATKAMWAWLNEADAKAITLEAIALAEKNLRWEADRLLALINAPPASRAAAV
jgi:hypothetical protein